MSRDTQPPPSQAAHTRESRDTHAFNVGTRQAHVRRHATHRGGNNTHAHGSAVTQAIQRGGKGLAHAVGGAVITRTKPSTHTRAMGGPHAPEGRTGGPTALYALYLRMGRRVMAAGGRGVHRAHTGAVTIDHDSPRRPEAAGCHAPIVSMLASTKDFLWDVLQPHGAHREAVRRIDVRF